MNTPPIKTIGLYLNPAQKVREDLLEAIQRISRENGVDTLLCYPECEWAAGCGAVFVAESVLEEKSDLIICIGGDGTLLGATRLIAGTPTPLWSVHVGRLGYLTDIMGREVPETFPLIFQGKYTVREIELLTARASRFSSGKILDEAHALNEITVEGGTGGVMISLAVEIDGSLMSNIDGNGIIVATPAGSTAYNLAAGGPILLENATAFVVNPICPHTLTNRPIIISNRSVVTIRPLSNAGMPQLVVDGQVRLRNLDKDIRIDVARSGKFARMIKTSHRSQFEILGEKLGWGNPRRP